VLVISISDFPGFVRRSAYKFINPVFDDLLRGFLVIPDLEVNIPGEPGLLSNPNRILFFGKLRSILP
jgi:hypothetical protein